MAVVPADFKSNDVAAAEVTNGVVTLVFAVTVVNVPAAAAVPPIAGGLAKYVLNPVPETVLDADSVVNAPVLAVVAPIDMLLIVPVVPELIVIVPAPVVVYD